MLEVCNYLSDRSRPETVGDNMKHPPINLATYEYNLGQAAQMKSETSTLNSTVTYVKSWFPRLGDHSQRRFMLGLLRRIHSVDLLSQLVNILQPLINKDFTYARMRTHPGLDHDIANLSSDRALTSEAVEFYITSTWDWFTEANYWTKANFAMTILQFCQPHLLYAISTQARTLLVTEEKALSAKEDTPYTEDESVCGTEYSYATIDHPDLKLLVQVSPDYGPIDKDPFTGEDLDIKVQEESNEDIKSDSSSSIDPACMVIPTGSKAYSGVSRHKDFVRLLPVHLAKYILSFLDRSSLSNALCVSSNWRSLAEEVHQEHYVNQQLIEEVMLMQGAAAQCANPVFARDIDVLVPNLRPGTSSVVHTHEAIVKTHFRSEVSFDTAYSGVSTRNVIMEERNVYCGAYNVMVLKEQIDTNRVVHTDGGTIVAMGSKDRKVRFLDTVSGKEKGPLIIGHAGSIRCVHICEKKGVVFSGSYDTSIRLWSIETGQCLKIFRGHRDTVNSIILLDETVASCGKDGACKLWDYNTGKCVVTFRHKSAVCTLALSKELCITGCESGKIRVWNRESGNLVKTLAGHHGAVTGIKFDKWHIVSCSRDGYVLAWSAQGDHSRCLTALRHPKEVLCLEFMYLRVITGSADGRLRIWNLITGQCCRIMRGNSRSDPILSIITNGDRITLNTSRNLLVLNFEKVDWDYTLESDAVPPLAQYGSYSDAPIPEQSYPYIRAMRMKKAGATNCKIINHSGKSKGKTPTAVPWYHTDIPAPQILHSSKTLSARSLESARKVQSSRSEMTFESQFWMSNTDGKKSESGRLWREIMDSDNGSPPASVVLQTPNTPGSKRNRSKSCNRPPTDKSQPSTVKIKEPPVQCEDTKTPLNIERRVSWAFDKPLLPSAKDISLSEMKALLRSQIRMKAENIVPPDFIYLTVNSIQRSMSQSETKTNTDNNLKDITPPKASNLSRPSSSPGKIDPRTKVPIEELGLEYLQVFSEEGESVSEMSDMKSIKSLRGKKGPPSKPPPPPEKEIYAVRCISTPLKKKKLQSVHPKTVKSTLPLGRVIRPLSAAVMQKIPVSPEFVKSSNQRPITAPVHDRPIPLNAIPPSIAPALPGTSASRSRKKQIHSEAIETNMVPMLMYSQEVKDRIEQLKMKKKPTVDTEEKGGIGKVSMYNDPLRSNIKFELKTNEQEQEIVNLIHNNYKNKIMLEEEAEEKRKRAGWLAKARSRP